MIRDLRIKNQESRIKNQESSDAVATEPGRQHRFEIGLRSRTGEVQVRLAQRIDQRANHVRAADRDATGRPDVGAQAIEKDDLSIEQDDGHLGPVLGVGRAATPLLRSSRTDGVDTGGGEELLARLNQTVRSDLGAYGPSNTLTAAPNVARGGNGCKAIVT